jgi:hypothetical protein
LDPTGRGLDHWWPIHPESDVNRLAEEVVSALTAEAEHFWKRYSDLDRVLAEFDAGARVPAGCPARLINAALLLRAGRHAEAQKAMNEVVKGAPRGSAAAKHVAERLGLEYTTS